MQPTNPNRKLAATILAKGVELAGHAENKAEVTKAIDEAELLITKHIDNQRVPGEFDLDAIVARFEILATQTLGVKEALRTILEDEIKATARRSGMAWMKCSNGMFFVNDSEATKHDQDKTTEIIRKNIELEFELKQAKAELKRLSPTNEDWKPHNVEGL